MLVFRGVHQQIVHSFLFVQIFHASHVTCAIEKKYTNHPEKTNTSAKKRLHCW